MAHVRRSALALNHSACAALALSLSCCAGSASVPEASSSRATHETSRLASAAGSPSLDAPRASATPAKTPSASDVSRSASPEAVALDPNSQERSALGDEPSIALDVPGFAPAVVALPTAARPAKPVVVALHGNFDRPEWQCSVWQSVVRARAFVLCPRGVPRKDAPKSWDRWEYASAKAMRAELEAGLTALRARFGELVADGPVVFIGFSLGAIYGVPLVFAEPERFSRVVFIEGGLSAWTAARAKKFVRDGGERLVLACGQPACLATVTRLGPLLTKSGLATRVGGDHRSGHSYDGRVAAAVAENWEFLVEGDPRWSLAGAQ